MKETYITSWWKNWSVIDVDVSTFTGVMPDGYDLVEYAEGECPIGDGYWLRGFDEVGMFVRENTKHAFVRGAKT